MKDNFCFTGILYLQFTNLSLLLGMDDSLCFPSPNQLLSTSLLCISSSFFGSLSLFEMHVGRFYYVLWWLIAWWFMIESPERNARRGKGRDLKYAPGGGYEVAMLCGLYLHGKKFKFGQLELNMWQFQALMVQSASSKKSFISNWDDPHKKQLQMLKKWHKKVLCVVRFSYVNVHGTLIMSQFNLYGWNNSVIWIWYWTGCL